MIKIWFLMMVAAGVAVGADAAGTSLDEFVAEHVLPFAGPQVSSTCLGLRGASTTDRLTSDIVECSSMFWWTSAPAVRRLRVRLQGG